VRRTTESGQVQVIRLEYQYPDGTIHGIPIWEYVDENGKNPYCAEQERILAARHEEMRRQGLDPGITGLMPKNPPSSGDLPSG